MRALCNSRGPRIGEEGVPRCRRTPGHAERGDTVHRSAPDDGWGSNGFWYDPEGWPQAAPIPSTNDVYRFAGRHGDTLRWDVTHLDGTTSTHTRPVKEFYGPMTGRVLAGATA